MNEDIQRISVYKKKRRYLGALIVNLTDLLNFKNRKKDLSL